MYRGKNQDYITDETLFSTIKSVKRKELCICMGKNPIALNSSLIHVIFSPVFVLICHVHWNIESSVYMIMIK